MQVKSFTRECDLILFTVDWFYNVPKTCLKYLNYLAKFHEL
jgi:hypothetical protein